MKDTGRMTEVDRPDDAIDFEKNEEEVINEDF